MDHVGQVKRRSPYAIPLLLSVIIGCLSLVLFSTQEEVTIALEILSISIIGFSSIAMLSYEAVLQWRAVDFPWVLTSFATIVVSLANISANDQRQQISRAQAEISRTFSDLVYATNSIITNDCQEHPTPKDISQSSPEPYKGACERIKHSLPQMINASDNFPGKLNADVLKEWGRKMIVPDTKPTGSWEGQVFAAQRLMKSADQYGPELQKLTGTSVDPLTSFVLSTRLRLWYFAMAFFVGLRLAKTTAEVLQAHAAATAKKESRA